MTSPEYELVLSSIRVNEPNDRVRAILCQGVDWNIVRAIAQHHRVLPLLYHWISKRAKEDIPTAEIAILRSIYQANVLRSLRQSRRLVQLSDVFAGHGIDCISFKGPVLGLQIYNDVALRQSFDLDILVRKRDLPRAYSALCDSGYTPEIPPGVLTAGQMARVNKHLRFNHGDSTLELHGEILESGMAYPVPNDWFWENMGTINLLNRPVKILNPEANLLMLSMQAAGDGWDILKWVADLAWCCHFNPPSDWMIFLSDARKWGVSRLVHLAILLAAEMGGAALPNSVLYLCQRDAGARKLANEVAKRLLANSQSESVNGLKFYLRAREHLRHRLYYVLDQSFVPKQVDWQVFGLPTWLSPAYYLLRPLRLAVKFTRFALRK